MILVSIAFMITPYIAQQYHENHLQEMRNLYGNSVNGLFVILLPIAGALITFAPLILSVFYGPSYRNAVDVFRIITIGYFFHSILGPNGAALAMIGRPVMYMIGTAIAAIISLFLYFLLIPKFSGIGAAISTIAGLSIMNILFSIQVYKYTQINPLAWIRFRLVPILLFSLYLSNGAVRLISINNVIAPLYLLIIGCGLLGLGYFGIAIQLEVISRRELAAIGKMLLRRQKFLG